MSGAAAAGSRDPKEQALSTSARTVVARRLTVVVLGGFPIVTSFKRIYGGDLARLWLGMSRRLPFEGYGDGSGSTMIACSFGFIDVSHGCLVPMDQEEF